jgi:hypothetical protein
VHATLVLGEKVLAVEVVVGAGVWSSTLCLGVFGVALTHVAAIVSQLKML